MQFLSRRRFLAGLTAGTAASVLLRDSAAAQATVTKPQFLRGTEFDLAIGERAADLELPT